MNEMRRPTYNVIPIKLKAAVSTNTPVQHVQMVYIVIYFDTTKESGETPTSAFIDAILDLARHDS